MRRTQLARWVPGSARRASSSSSSMAPEKPDASTRRPAAIAFQIFDGKTASGQPRVPCEKMDLGLPVGADEGVGVREGRLASHPLRETLHPRSVATYGHFVSVVDEAPAHLEEAREMVAPAEVAGVEGGARAGRSRLSQRRRCSSFG